MGKTIEVLLASPPDRDTLVAQLFHANDGQWGEIYREDGAYKVEFFTSPNQLLTLDCEECLLAMGIAIRELKSRLESA